MKNIKGVIFDLDGTLIDSMWMWGVVARRYLISQGAEPRADLESVLRSFNTVEEAMYYKTEYGVTLPPEEVIAGRNGMMMEFFCNEVQLKPDVLEFIKLMHEHGVKMCIATATERELVEPAVQRFSLPDYIERIFTCEEENTSKINPDIYIRAAEFMGTDIGNTLVVEDALYAMKTAKKAGFIVSGVYDLSSDDLQDEIEEVCDYYWKDLQEALLCFTIN